MSLAARLDIPEGGRRGRDSNQPGRSTRTSPYIRPTTQLPEDGNWVHDKFAEVNDIPKAGGALAARISGGTASTAGAKLLQNALGRTGSGSSRPNPGGRVASAGSLNIKGASTPTSTTLEVRELVAGTTVEDVKAIFSECGKITDSWTLPSSNPATAVIRVTFAERSGMTRAIQKYDKQSADGRTLSVKEVVMPTVAKTLDGAMEVDSGSGSKGKMYSDSIEGGVTITRPPRIDLVNDNWSRGGGSGGGSGGGRSRGGRNRGGRGRGGNNSMQVD